MKVWARQLALGLLLTAAIPAAAVRAADGAEQILLDKANYWRLKDRPDLARASLDKLLALNPGQPEALYAYGVLELQLGNVVEAQNFLTRLQKSAPQDSRGADLQAAIGAGRIDTAALGEARKLGQSGDYPDAVRKYQETFKGGPAPATYRVEYYLTLAAMPAGRDEARRALEQMAQTAPSDAGIKLALAEISTYSEASRASGIAVLAQLSNDPAVGPAAIRAWHQALLWLGGTREARALYEQYLTRFPQDAEIRQHRAEAPPDSEVADKGPAIDYQAYVALQKGSLAGAESQFTAALRLHPNDSDALAGLGMVRLRQGRFAEARDLLGRATKAVPARQPEWATAYDSAVFWAGVQDAKALVAAGNYQRARANLTALLAHKRPDNWGAELLLAEVEGKLGNKLGAEQAYRRVLAAKPQNTDAIVGLATVLTAEGKSDEAMILAGRLSAADRARLGGMTTQSDALRTAAKDAAARGDPSTAREKFREAVAADPKNPWLRLDFARFLAGTGAAAQGFATIDPNQSGNTPTSLQAAAIFDDEQHRPADALAKLDRIPANARTAEMGRFRTDIVAAGTIERAKLMANAGKRADARKLLVALFHDPEIKPADRSNIPHVLASLGDTDAAAQLYREAAAQRGPDGTRAAIDYAWLLLKDGNETQASAVVAQIDAGGRASSANPEVQKLPELQKLKVALAVRKADTLRRRGDTAGAIAQLTPLLGANPGDAGLLLAVGRAYAEAGQHRQARQYFETAYRRNPGDADALAALIDGAIQSRDTDGARRYLGEAMSAYPNNARFYYLQAQLARAEGDTRAALRALETARTLNGQQRPETAGEGSSTPGSGSSLPPVEVPDWAGSSMPQAADGAPAPLETTVKSADSDDLVAAPATSRIQIASLPPDAVSDGAAGADTVVATGGGNPRPQLAQLELNIPGPVGGYQPPVDSGPVPAQDSLQLDIERSMAAIEAESSPMIQGGLIYRGREGQSGLSSLNEIGMPIEGRFSPWLTGTMTVNVSPIWLDAGSVGTGSLSQFGANGLLSAYGLSQVSPSEQSVFGVLTSVGYAYGPYSAKIGEAAWGFPVTNIIGNLAYQPKFLNDTLSVRIEALRQPVTDSVLSYAGAHASFGTANAIPNVTAGAFGTNGTWGGVTKSGVRGSVFYDDNNFGAYGILGAAYLNGTNVAENGMFEATAGAYFRPYRSDNDALRVGVSLAYFGYDKNLSFYSFGQGGYFSPQNYEALTFPVEYQGRTDRWSYLVAVALGVQHFNTNSSPFFPNNPFAQQALVQAAGAASAVYPGASSTGLATDLRAQVEYALDKDTALGVSGQYDNGNSYNEGIVKLYIRKTFSDPPAVTAILPGTPMGNSR